VCLSLASIFSLGKERTFRFELCKQLNWGKLLLKLQILG
jgi:hypothetical protein